jgi:hypothetical protein
MARSPEPPFERGSVRCSLPSAVLACGAAPASAATWTAQSSGTINTLKGISYPSASACWAVGLNGTIVATTNVRGPSTG